MFRVRNQLASCSVLHDEARPTAWSFSVHRPSARTARFGLGLALMLALPLGAQVDSALMQSTLSAGTWQYGIDGVDNNNHIGDQKRLRALNAERQKSMVKDADKLLKLARELDEDVNRPTNASFDQAEYSKVAEIEKLAHKVKDKMSSPVQAPENTPWINSPSHR